MKCLHCTIDFHENWIPGIFAREKVEFILPFGSAEVYWYYRTAICSQCKDGIIEIAPKATSGSVMAVDWRMVYPVGASRGPVSPEVPEEIAQDYIEACNVLPFSAKASAALSRRCLQNILHNAGYMGRDLNAEIDLLLNEDNPKKAIPQRLRDTIDAIRNFGNFGAHPINAKTALQIIEVDDHEAEWCLEILEECVDHFYVGPAITKVNKDALNAKLAAAKKPPSK
jgi:hypothetical protein